jgi:acyl-CoA reductase-like NAD-dependent aldehyde dehydrogenase
MQTQETLFIDGQWVAPASRATIDVISPHTEEVIARVPEGCEADIDRAVAAARTAFDAACARSLDCRAQTPGSAWARKIGKPAGHVQRSIVG